MEVLSKSNGKVALISFSDLVILLKKNFYMSFQLTWTSVFWWVVYFVFLKIKNSYNTEA